MAENQRSFQPFAVGPFWVHPSHNAEGQPAGSIALSFLNLGSGNLVNIELSALEADGRGKVISSPRVITADKKKAVFNKATRTKAKNAIDGLKANPTVESLASAFSMLDKAAKRGVIKVGKANRLKSRLSKKVA